MHTEIEVKFIDVNLDEVRARLKQLGANLVHRERILRRRNFDFPDLRLSHQHHAWVRVRDEGDKATITYKQTDDHTVQGTQEINLSVNAFEPACQFLIALGMKEKSYQETKRESWTLDGVEIELDTWPWIPPFIELEGEHASALQTAASKLGLNWAHHLAGDVTAAYQAHYDFDVLDLWHKPIVFGPRPDWIKPK